MIRFRATAVAAQEMLDLNAYVIILAEDEGGEGRRVELQRSVHFDDQDRALGMDKHCLVTESGDCSYGCVSSWALVGDALQIELSPSGEEELSVGGGFHIDLPIGAAESLRGPLNRVFADDVSQALYRQ